MSQVLAKLITADIGHMLAVTDDSQSFPLLLYLVQAKGSAASLHGQAGAAFIWIQEPCAD